MTPDKLLARSEAIRWPVRDLAQAAGLPKDTVARALGRTKAATDPRTSTVVKIEAAIAAEELRLRDYLTLLHPICAHAGAS
jgi:hypothetical protein